MIGVSGIIEDDNANFLTVHGAIVIYPVSWLSPDVLFGLQAIGVGHETTILARHAISKANREETFFGVAKFQVLLGGEGGIDVDGTGFLAGGDGDDALFLKQGVLVGRLPIEGHGNGARIFARFHVADRSERQRTLRFGVIAAGLRFGLGFPEVDAIDVSESDPEAAMVGMVAGLTFDVFLRPAPGDYETGGGAKRREERFGVGGAVEEVREGLVIDGDGDVVSCDVFKLDLGVRNSAAEQTDGERETKDGGHSFASYLKGALRAGGLS